MNVMLLMIDGKVNTEPGDTVEYWNTADQAWHPAVYLRMSSDTFHNQPMAIMRDAQNMPRVVDLPSIRHSKNGPGHVRHQNAHMRAFIESVRSGGDVNTVYSQDVDTFLKWLDEYEYTNFEGAGK